MKTINLTITLLFALCLQSFGQHIGLTFQEADKQGISVSHLDSIYKIAVHADTTLDVFKTEEEQQAFQKKYITLLQDFGKYLSQNNFIWEKPTKFINGIYFNTDGTIDYFLYNFLWNSENVLSEKSQVIFNELLNKFIKDYKFGLTAKEKFAQYIPTIYITRL